MPSAMAPEDTINVEPLALQRGKLRHPLTNERVIHALAMIGDEGGTDFDDDAACGFRHYGLKSSTGAALEARIAQTPRQY